MDEELMKNQFLAAYDAHADEIYRFCFFKVSSKERAEDLTQEVFVELWQAYRKQTTLKNTRAFLFTIARNRIIDWYRKKKESSLDAITEKGMDFEGTSGASVSLGAEFSEAMAAVDQLDALSKEALTLRFVEGWSPQEIALLSNESANAVSVRINRAMKKVQVILHERV